MSGIPPHPVPDVRTPRPASGHRADVQGLRAVAVLLVLASHVLGAPAGGFVGVDVFFVISGFLITGLLVREQRRSGRISLREFYARRARRLLPMAVLVLAVTNLAAWLLFTGDRAAQALQDAAWAVGFAANVRFAAVGTDYFDQTRPASPVQHYWSLAVEEQFYLLWPWLLLAVLTLLRRRTGLVLLVVLALSGLSLTWSATLTAGDPTAAYFSAPARAWELGVGAVLALAVHADLLRRLPRRLGGAFAWVGLVAIGLAAVRYDARTPFPGTAALLPVLGAALVLAGSSRNPLLVNPVAAYVGRVSYSLYLWHWPVLIVGSALLPPGPERIVAVLSVSALLTVLGHHLVEEPVRRSAWLSRRPAAAAAAPSSGTVLGPLPTARRGGRRAPARTAVAVTAVTGLLVGGWVLPALALSRDAPAPPATVAAARPPVGESAGQLQSSIRESLAATSWPALDPGLADISRSGAPEWIVDRCDNVNAGNLDRCRYGDLTAPRTLALVGDSMAISWLPALRRALEPQGWRIQVLTRNQCPNPRTGFWRDDPDERFTSCDDHKAWVLQQVTRLRPDLVLASNSLTFLDHQLGEPQGAARFGPWEDGLAEFLGDLRAVSPRVVVLGPPPRSGNLQECVTRLSTPSDCTRTVPGDWRGLLRAEKSAAARSGSDYLDPEAWFCAAGRCPAVVGGTPVYTDGRHLTEAYARRLAPRLEAALGLP